MLNPEAKRPKRIRELAPDWVRERNSLGMVAAPTISRLIQAFAIARLTNEITIL